MQLMTTPVEQRMVEVLDAEVVGTEVELAPPANLFRADNPAEVIERATEVANTLKGVLDKQGLTKNIQGRSHVLVEGWTTCGAMLGVVPVVVWTRQTENGWEARTEARTLDGRVVGAAEASCTRDERTWKSREDYALRSMAQTRATSKALRGPLGFIVTLAGYAATPGEEMPEAAPSPQSDARHPYGPAYTKETAKKAGAACVKLAGGAPLLGVALWKLIEQDSGAYMPEVVARALIRAANAESLAPDVASPEVQ